MQHEQTIVCLATLFFGAKIKGLAEEAGYQYKGAIGPTGLVKRIKEFNPAAVLLDLSKDDYDIQQTVKSIQEITKSPIIAFCGHVATDLINTAREAGCDLVTTNGAITGSFQGTLHKALTLR